ncbi:MAG TPA: class I SAM-dependent methyltransferase [Bellilinea sp.]|nr:class I SAM-dependent methyltransferase [Bellilinea sp.]
MNTFTKSIALRVSRLALTPLRLAARMEFNENIKPIFEKDIQMALESRSLRTTAEYVERKMRSTHSYRNKFDMFDSVLSTVRAEGLWLEFGVYSGESINYIASKTSSIVYGFDSFEGLPEFWRDGFNAGHFAVSKLPDVSRNVELIKGWFDQTLPVFIGSKKDAVVSFLHIDCDLYSSTKTIFDILGRAISDGTIIVFDEYFNYPGWEHGEFKAFQEFIGTSGFSYEYIGYVSTHEQVAVRVCKTGASP